MELAKNQNHDAMLEYLENLPAAWSQREKILLEDLATVRKIFNRITKLMQTSTIN